MARPRWVALGSGTRGRAVPTPCLVCPNVLWFDLVGPSPRLQMRQSEAQSMEANTYEQYCSWCFKTAAGLAGECS